MAVDPRQVLGAFLTLSMFAMLSNMVKRDYFDSSEVGFQGVSSVQFGVIRVEDKGVDDLPSASKGPWRERDPELKPCWTKPSPLPAKSKGYITFSLTNGPGHHEFLGAALVLPEIRGRELGQQRAFGDVYDVGKLRSSLDGVVEVIEELPGEVAVEHPAVVRIPDGVTEGYISSNVEPIFRKKGHLRLAVFFPPGKKNLRAGSRPREELDSLRCLARFGALELSPEMQEVAVSMTDGHFVAVDLRLEVLDGKSCKEEAVRGRRSCYSPQEVGEFLTRAGFDAGTTVYLTQTWWHESLDALKGMFPRTLTKLGGDDLGKVLDLYICSQSDVFLPAVPDLPFHGSVVGRRIAAGRTQILSPSSSPPEFISAAVSGGGHEALSCYC
ncbi:unnamed protein product [Spirodela intermedia]|uniref:O-fucosyltransferase family protein n=1 Tax=Spirodela intermedia TaxID=51605 RepID=A0A7I8JM01_SPIIN|nr:unnamed protein product [Spirodela intermedia]CAA6671130.1 unnamed protein product [Spirodela intermedia]